MGVTLIKVICGSTYNGLIGLTDCVGLTGCVGLIGPDCIGLSGLTGCVGFTGLIGGVDDVGVGLGVGVGLLTDPENFKLPLPDSFVDGPDPVLVFRLLPDLKLETALDTPVGTFSFGVPGPILKLAVAVSDSQNCLKVFISLILTYLLPWTFLLFDSVFLGGFSLIYHHFFTGQDAL